MKETKNRRGCCKFQNRRCNSPDFCDRSDKILRSCKLLNNQPQLRAEGMADSFVVSGAIVLRREDTDVAQSSEHAEEINKNQLISLVQHFD